MNSVEKYPYFKNRGQMKKILLTIGKELLNDVDEVGLARGFNSRSATLRRLIEAGVKEFKQQKAAENPQG
ncbi:hypothetical protein COMNV_00481 [Commensalibacter sp. Nvir]|uniref:CopG family ribbon-helix-helix protein n=1 Tax=Commensalibacter sp. Nvir TaxID=3069817 RepID=UPI002D4160C9|nr:hypothetical protein COMNV_00481 [Commensalibacter sp. Nvir]